MYKYTAEQFLPIDIKTAWDFFSSPKNLAKITPPEMGFIIHTKLKEEEIYEGMLIDYTVHPVLGIPLKWQTQITGVNRHQSFTDKQLKGPYKVWEHTHTFTKQKNGVLMHDEILYQLPLGILGNIAHSVFVKSKIESIFAFRKQILEKMFV